MSQDPCQNDSLVMRLIMLAHRLEETAERAFFAPHGLSMSTGRILMYLFHSGPQTPTEILQALGGKKSNITQRIANLEKLNMVARQTPKPHADRRQIRIGLSPAGTRCAKQLDAIFNTNIAALEQSIPKQQHAATLSVFNLIDERLDSSPLSTSR
jgi:DNA-binding MarR family transcriptional regulator